MASKFTATVLILWGALLALSTFTKCVCEEVNTRKNINGFLGRLLDGRLVYHASDKKWYTKAMEETKFRVQNLQTWKDKSSSSPIISLGPMTTQFFMVLEVGTPSQPALMSIDSGSELAWLQCQPCHICFNQTSTYASQIFDPSQSSSYVSMGCSNPICAAGESVGATFSCDNENCTYRIQYVDTSYTRGVLSTEDVLLKHTDDFGETHELNLKGWVFGCGHTNQGRFGGGASGILGLNEGELSFQNQLAATQVGFSKSFAYCFPNRFAEDTSTTGYIYFGDTSQLVNSQLLATPMVTNPVEPYFYYIDLVGISVDGEYLNIDSSAWKIQSDGTGGTRLDTGTTYFLASSLVYDVLLAALEAGTPNEMERDKKTEGTTGLGLCVTVQPEADISNSVPKLTLHLSGLHEGGSIVNWELPSGNYFLPIDPEKSVFCYAVFTLPGISFNILGNSVVQDHLIAINQDKREYAISSVTDCSRPPL